MFELRKSECVFVKLTLPPPIEVFQLSKQNWQKNSSEPAVWPSLTSSSGSTQPWSRCPPCQSCGPLWGCLCWCSCSPGPSYSNACSGTGWRGTLPRLRSLRRAQPPPNALWTGRHKAAWTFDTVQLLTKWRREVTAGFIGSDVIKAARMSWCCGAELDLYKRKPLYQRGSLGAGPLRRSSDRHSWIWAVLKRQRSGLSRSCWRHMVGGQTGSKVARLQNNRFCDYRFEGAYTHAHKWISLRESCPQVTIIVDDQWLKWQTRISI